jgi:hypothetical protein
MTDQWRNSGAEGIEAMDRWTESGELYPWQREVVERIARYDAHRPWRIILPRRDRMWRMAATLATIVASRKVDR